MDLEVENSRRLGCVLLEAPWESIDVRFDPVSKSWSVASSALSSLLLLPWSAISIESRSQMLTIVHADSQTKPTNSSSGEKLNYAQSTRQNVDFDERCLG